MGNFSAYIFAQRSIAPAKQRERMMRSEACAQCNDRIRRFGKRTSSSEGALKCICADLKANATWLYYASVLDKSTFTQDLQAILHHSVGRNASGPKTSHAHISHITERQGGRLAQLCGNTVIVPDINI